MNKKKLNKKKTKLNKDLITLLIIGIIGTIISFITLGDFITLILVVGVIFILLFSKLATKLRKRKKSRNIINAIIIFVLIISIIGVLGIGAFCIYIVKNAPDFDPEKLAYSESTLIYDKDNNLIAELGTEKRETITYDQMSEVLVDAIIATEDSRFFQHNGFDAARFIKASVGQAISKLIGRSSSAGGASTLSMQVIKNSFTSAEASGIKGIIRKFTDIYLSVFKLEKNYTKQEIIEFYVNNHFLGNNAYGVQQAAKTYFGKKASDLNLSEAAMIVGLFKAPTAYNPYINEEAAEQRRSTVLNLMYNHGYITKEERDMAKSVPIKSLLVEQSGEEQKYQSYIDTVVEELDEKYNVNPYTTSLEIYTNMDAAKQEKIDKIFSGESFKWKKDYHQAGVAAVESNTGKIVAIGAGRNRTGVNSYNYATMINRQIGSTSKPIIDYAPGMEYLNWSTATIFKDEPWSYSSGQSIKNSNGKFSGDVTIRTALQYSKNIPALKAFQTLAKEIGLNEYKKFVQSFGIQTEDYFHEAHSIGAFNGSNPLTMAAAYAVFSNGGYYYEPYSVSQIIYRDTGEVIEYESEGKRIISDSTAYMITDCLITAVKQGYSADANISGYNIAAKTGTTNFDSATFAKYKLPGDAVPDGWINGYDSEISISIWYGCKEINNKAYLTETDSNVQKGKLFKAVAKAVLTPGKTFKVPNSVVKVEIEKGTNPPKLASASTPEKQKTYEYFKKGTEPTEVSSKYNKQSNITGLIVEYNPGTNSVNIDWNGVANIDEKQDATYGDFGYKIYKDNSFIGFTTDTTYTIYDVDSPYGTYKVVTTYENYSDNASSGVSYLLENKSLSVNLNRPSSITYSLNETINNSDSNPSISDITVLNNSIDVTNNASISIVITNSNNTTVSSINTTTADKYTIKYTIVYNSVTKTISRTIKVG